MYYLVVHVDINGEGGWVGGESMAQWRNLWLVAQMLCQDAFYKEYVCSACAGGGGALCCYMCWHLASWEAYKALSCCFYVDLQCT